MRSGLTLNQTNIIDADVKTDISWLFEIDRTGNGSVDDYWSTKAKTWNGQAYTYKVMDFSPITMNRALSELGIQTPSGFSFTLTNQNNTLLPSAFSGGNVTVRLVIAADLSARPISDDITLSTDVTAETYTPSESEIITWNFDIVSVSSEYQTLKFECRDWLQKYINDGYWPNLPLVHALWPTNEYGSYDYCIPVVFGTVYTPVPSAFISTDRFYLIGPDAPTYTITKARNPDKYGNKVEWLPASFTFTQSTKTVGAVSYKALQVIAADANSDSIMDANVTFKDGEEFLPLSVKYSRSDLVSYTNPADMIDYILKDMGIPTAKIDTTTQVAAHDTYDTWGLTFNAAFVKQESREKILSRLLTMARMELIVRDKIYYKIHSKVSQQDIEKEWVVDGSFNYEAKTPSKSDSGYVIYPHVSGDVPVTSQNKARVPAKTTTTTPSSIQIEAYYVFSSTNAQKIGTLDLQRQLLPDKTITFTAKGKALALEPDDVVTINPADYGAGSGYEYDVLIDSMTISKDLLVSFSCTGFSAALDDWADLSPTTITTGTDATLKSYQPVTAGPDSSSSATGEPSNILPGRLRLGEGSDYILLDPATPLRMSIYDNNTEIYRAGDLNGFLSYSSETYGLAIGDSDNYMTYDQTNGLRISGLIRSSVSYGSTFITKGTFLTASCDAGDSVIYVQDTSDFVAPGTAYIISSTNDRDTFTYTGVTSTTITGCSGILDHSIGSNDYVIIAPADKGIYISGLRNEMRFFGDRGDSTVEELASIGLTYKGSDYTIISVGTVDTTIQSIYALGKGQFVIYTEGTGDNGATIYARASSTTSSAVQALNTTSGYGLYADSSSSGWGIYAGHGIYATTGETHAAVSGINTSSGSGGYFTSSSGYAVECDGDILVCADIIYQDIGTVTFGANDSGGSGYRVLLIPNA